jgi:hypothetical protein
MLNSCCYDCGNSIVSISLSGWRHRRVVFKHEERGGGALSYVHTYTYISLFQGDVCDTMGWAKDKEKVSKINTRGDIDSLREGRDQNGAKVASCVLFRRWLLLFSHRIFTAANRKLCCTMQRLYVSLFGVGAKKKNKAENRRRWNWRACTHKHIPPVQKLVRGTPWILHLGDRRRRRSL